MKIEIDSRSGFCHGVVSAIAKAEEELGGEEPLYCLGDIVHNSDEVERLERAGLKTITHDDLGRLEGVKVLLRAHGEPPTTYAVAAERRIEIIDATCPVVLRLQQRIKATFDTEPESTQIVIYGKPGHAEVNGLVGQTGGKAIVVQHVADLDRLDFTRNIELYSQTTKSLEGFSEIIREIRSRMAPGTRFNSYDTICRQVANRVGHLKEFAAAHDVVLFVSGAKSSNGRVLYDHCHSVNPRTHLVSNGSEVNSSWFEGAESVGVCGATSTPRWLMEQVRDKVEAMVNE
ncbi:MAG: 4-hydroxy-3-methylbut-2-enyl diphosphate reductase [Bacteroides sp.]|nr:4-hydroxy-3-methylbut-2-enyl diphosphate reductase [Bacteroides sp.]MBD5378031.1 4-hydroxy-3-methylbut-2-enyl diphosphate reductase [Bacteroides sp.]